MAKVLSKEERKNRIDKLTKKEIDAEIRDVKKKTKELKEDIKSKETKKAELAKAHAKRVNKLETAHQNDLKAINDEKAALEKEAALLAEERSAEAAKEKEAIEVVAKRKAQLKERHKNVIAEENKKAKEQYEEEVVSYNNKLSDLRRAKKTQTETFAEASRSLDESYRRTEEELNAQKAALNDRKNDIDNTSRAEIEALEKERDELNMANKVEYAQRVADNDEEVKKLSDAEEAIINEKKAELNTWYLKLDETSDRKAIAEDDYDKTVSRMENEYNELVSKYDAERASMNQRNDSLRREIELRREENDKERSIALENYKLSLNELNELIASFGEQESISAATLKRVLQDKDDEYKKKYSEFVDYLDEECEQERIARDKDLEDLRYRIGLEQEELKNRNIYLKERYDNREAEYKRANEALIADNSELENKITELQNSYAARINDLKADLLNIRNSHDAAIEAKKKELAVRLEEVRDNKAAYKEKIDNEKDEVIAKVNRIDEEIVGVKEDLNVYLSNAKVKENALIAKHQDLVAHILEEKDKINGLREELEAKIADDVETRKGLLAEIEEKRRRINSEHEQKVAEINSQHEVQMDELKTAHEEKMAEIAREHDALLDTLSLQHEQKRKEIEDEDLKRKGEFDEQKFALLKQTQDLDDDNEARINKIHAHKSDLLNQIQLLKDNYDREQTNYDESREEMDRYKNETINQLEENFRAQVEEINSDVTPVNELEETKNRYNAKLMEHENILKYADEERNKIDKEISDYIDASNAEKARVEDELAQANMQYEDRKRSAGEEYERFQAELKDRQKQFEDFKADVEQELADIRQKNADELQELLDGQNSRYEEVSNSYKEKEDSVQNIYDQEIRFKTDELEAKKKEYTAHLEDLRRRKAKSEYDYNNRYNVEQAKTTTLQHELDELNSTLATKRVEWSRELEARKLEMDEEISGIRSSNNSIISENRKALEEKIMTMNKRMVELKDEILRLEESANTNRNELDSYKNSKTIEYENMKVRTNEYLNDINRRLNEIANKSIELEEAHESRVVDVKKLIAKSISEYENLGKTLPFALKREEDLGADQLLNKASEFKEKLDELDRTHKDLMEKMEARKEEALSRIEKEFNDVLFNDNSVESQYAEDFDELSNAYERLIVMEAEKQLQLQKDIESINDIYNHELNDYTVLADKYAAGSKYKKILDKVTSAVDILSEKKNNVLEELNDLLHKYNSIDDEINSKKEQLMDIFRSKSKQIDDYYAQAVENNRNQLRDFDVLRDDVTNIFKKRS